MIAGIIGAGYIADEHLNAMLACGITDICICDKNEEQAHKLASKCNGRIYTNADEMFETSGIDFVSVCTPTSTHFPIVLKALDKKIPVLCEKPFSATLEEANQMIIKSRETNTMLMVAHCLRFGKAYAYLKNCINDGRFGKLLSLTMFRHSTEPLWSVGSWLSNCEVSGGAVVDLHIHETDMAVFLLGAPKAVTTVGGYKQCSTVYHYDIPNLAVSAQSSWRPTRTYPFCGGFDANFEGATVLFKGDIFQVFTDDGELDNALAKESFPDYITDKGFYVNEMKYFIECLPLGKAANCNPNDSMTSLKVVHAELASILQNKTINID